MKSTQAEQALERRKVEALERIGFLLERVLAPGAGPAPSSMETPTVSIQEPAQSAPVGSGGILPMTEDDV